MFANNNSDYNLEMEVLFYPSPLPSPSMSFEKVKFLIFYAILIKFESKYFYMFIVNK